MHKIKMEKFNFSLLLKIFVFILILGLYGSLAAYKIKLPATDDLGRHIKNGEMVLQTPSVLYTNFYSYTEPNFPVVNHHWLFGVIIYVVNEIVGFSGIVIFKIIILSLTFAVLFLAALKKADFWLVAFFSLPTILLLMGRMDARPEIFSFLFIAIFIYFLIDLEKNPNHKRIFWLIPLQTLWINLHIFFSIGIMLVAGFLIEKIIINRKNLKGNLLIKKLFLLLAALVLASFINPYGIAAAIYNYHLHNLSDYPIKISENKPLLDSLKQSPPWDSIPVSIFIPMLVFLGASFVLSFIFGKMSIFYLLATIGSAAAGFFMVRGVALFGFIFLPAISTNFNSVFIKFRDWFGEKWPRIRNIFGKVLIFILIAVFSCLIFIGVKGKIIQYKEPGIGLTDYSNSSADFFKKQGLYGPIFNDTDIGSYLIYNFFPQERVFVDNRFGDAYSKPFFSDIYLPIIREESAWQEMLKKYRFNTIFFYHYDGGDYVRPFLSRRIADPSWALVYADRYVVIFLRNIPENKNVIKQFQITRENISEKLKYMTISKDPEDQIAAADIFNIAEREDLAMETFKKVVAKYPEKSRVWMIMGEMVVVKDDFSNLIAAMLFLENAIKYGEKTAEAYSLLSLAYLKTGQFEKSDIAARETLKIDPNNVEAKDYLKKLQAYFEPIK